MDSPVVFLIQEKSGFLPVFYIYLVFHAILLNLHQGIEGITDKSLDPLHSFLGPHLRVAALIDAADPDAVFLHHFF